MSASPEVAVNAGKEGRAHRFETLDEAFQRYGTPAANQALVRRIVESADVAGIVGFRTYFKLERRSGPALEVHAGYTNGFRNESDAVRLAGDIERWPSRRFQGAWGVTHPETRPRAAQPASRRFPGSRVAATPRPSAVPERAEAVCPTCFMVLPRTGVCDTCG
ncbi:hypothetical protein [Microbacterium lacusdiani]